MATKFDALMARRGEIMRKALGMDYSVFEQSPVAFDYEGMMTAHGYSLDDIVGIQAQSRRRQHPAARAQEPHRPGAQHQRARQGCAHLRQGRGRQPRRRLQGPPRQRQHPRGEGEGLRGRDRGDVGQLRRRRRQPGGAQRPQVHHLPGDLRQPQGRPAGDRREGPHLRVVRGRGRADDRGPRALLPHGRAARRDRLLRRLALQLVRGERHRDPRPRARPRDDGSHRGAADARRGHPRRRRQHDRHGARPQARRGDGDRDRQRLGRPQRAAHGERHRLQPQELHHGAHRLRRAVRDLARPRRRAAQRGPAAALPRPLPHGHAGRGLLHHRGDGQARGPRARPGRQHGDDRRREPRPRPAPRGHGRRPGDRVHGRRQAPLVAAQLRQGDGRRRSAPATRRTTCPAR